MSLIHQNSHLISTMIHPTTHSLFSANNFCMMRSKLKLIFVSKSWCTNLANKFSPTTNILLEGNVSVFLNLGCLWVHVLPIHTVTKLWPNSGTFICRSWVASCRLTHKLLSSINWRWTISTSCGGRPIISCWCLTAVWRCTSFESSRTLHQMSWLALQSTGPPRQTPSNSLPLRWCKRCQNSAQCLAMITGLPASYYQVLCCFSVL